MATRTKKAMAKAQLARRAPTDPAQRKRALRREIRDQQDIAKLVRKLVRVTEIADTCLDGLKVSIPSRPRPSAFATGTEGV